METKTTLKEMAESIHQERKQKIIDLKKSEHKEIEEKKKKAEECAFLCLKIFSVSTKLALKESQFIRWVRIYEEYGKIHCQISLNKEVAEIEKETIRTEQMTHMPTVMEAIQEVEKIVGINSEIMRYMVEELRKIPHFKVIAESISNEVIAIRISMNDIVVGETAE